MTTRLDRAIAKLRAMSNEEYESLINRHSTSEDSYVNFPLIHSESNYSSYIITFKEAYTTAISEFQRCDTVYLGNDSQKFGAYYIAPNLNNLLNHSETYQQAA